MKQGLTTLEDLGLTDDYDDYGNGMSWGDILRDGENIWNADAGLDEGELDELLKDAASTKKPQAPREPPKKKQKTASHSKPPPVFDLVEPEFATSKPTSSRAQLDAGSDAYGEATSLQHADAADKSARKKSLRFHTSKIESASARRQGARNQAVGGDDDLPYRERRKEKEARLAKEAAAKVRGQGGEDLDDTEPERKAEKRRREEDSDGEQEADGSDGYYELIKKKSKERKEQKKADYEAFQAAARYGPLCFQI